VERFHSGGQRLPDHVMGVGQGSGVHGDAVNVILRERSRRQSERAEHVEVVGDDAHGLGGVVDHGEAVRQVFLRAGGLFLQPDAGRVDAPGHEAVEDALRLGNAFVRPLSAGCNGDRAGVGRKVFVGVFDAVQQDAAGFCSVDLAAEDDDVVQILRPLFKGVEEHKALHCKEPGKADGEKGVERHRQPAGPRGTLAGADLALRKQEPNDAQPAGQRPDPRHGLVEAHDHAHGDVIEDAKKPYKEENKIDETAGTPGFAILIQCGTSQKARPAGWHSRAYG